MYQGCYFKLNGNVLTKMSDKTERGERVNNVIPGKEHSRQEGNSKCKSPQTEYLPKDARERKNLEV